MNKSKRKIIILLVCMMFVLTGCTKTLKGNDKKVVTYEKTGQSLTENILCKPTNQEVIKLYEENNVKVEKLVECKNFKVTSGGYEGLWTSIFVKPLAWLIIKIGNLINSYGASILIVSMLIRIVTIPITKKTAMQSENMKKAQPEIDRLEKKYKNKPQDNQEIMMQKTQEQLAIYKKYNINPMSGCLFSMLQIPVFFAFLEAVNRVPALFEGKFLGLHLGTTPMVALAKGQYYYLILIALIIYTTYLSFKLNSTATSADTEKQMKFMSRFMIIFISIASFSLPTSIAIYWVTSSVFTILQNLWIKREVSK
ncbi:MAG: YidC/Oxa1 family membrane protein insertase [Firmicutes bacterium]|nr:YidC/Oxa1 family membrane protein insertase [Bacillota bacterium]